MGDVLVSSPVIDALRHRWPEARIDVLVRKGAADMVASHPEVNELLVADEGELDSRDGFHRWLEEVRRRRYDLGLVLWSRFAEAWLLWRAGVPHRVGQDSRLTYSWMYTHRVPIRSEHGDTTSHWVDCQLDYARAVGADLPEPFPRLFLTDAARTQTAAICAEAGIEGPYAVLHVGRGIPLDREKLPPEPFAAMADAIAREHRLAVVLTGGPSEIDVVTAVAETMHEPCVSLAGRLSVPQLGALLERASLVVANDSGPMHMAAGVGAPTVGIFAMQSDLPRRWGPWRGEIVRPDRFRCSAACRKETCARMTCYEDITPEMVVAATRRALRQR